jgi:type I restriction enzyme, S subunit
VSDASEFNTVQLGSLFDKVHGGGTPPRNNPLFWKGEIPWASVKDFTDDKYVLEETEEHISEEGLRNSTSKLIPENIPVICLRMAVGRSALTVRAVSINQDLKALFPREDVEPKYVVYLLQQFRDVIEAKAIGSTVKGITTKDLLKTYVPFPGTREEQQKIAKILTTVDNLIEKTEALIEKYQAIKQGMMHDLFTRGIDNNGQLRPSHHDAPHLYKLTELGWIPKEWEIHPITDLSIGGLKNGYFKKPELVGSGLKLINVSELYQDYGIDIKLESVERVEVNAADYKKYKVEIGDLFFTRSSLVLAGIAKCNIVRKLQESTVYECHVMRLKPNQELVVPDFLALFCQTRPARDYLMARAKQVAMTTISQPDIQNMPIPKPDLNEQIRIVERVIKVIEIESSQKKYLEKLQSQKKGLMQDLLTGEVRVTLGK